MTPVDPLKNAMGKNTADNTVAIPTSAPVISPMDSIVAARGERFFSRIKRSTFSTTTIASSTSKPIDSTMPNMVKVLIEYPKTDSTPKVPRRTTGTAIAGIRVARQFCRKTNMTTTTNTMASNKVFTTSSMETLMNLVLSLG